MERALRDQDIDLEAWETCLRTAVLAAGARVLEEVLQGVGCGRREDSVLCECGHVMKSVGLREKVIQTILGSVHFRRSLYGCASCGKTCFPGDALLGVEGTGFSPGLRRMMARAGSRTSFAEAEEDLREYAGLEIGRKEIERVAEAVGRQIETWSRKTLYRNSREKAQVSGRNRKDSIPILYASFDGTGVPIQRRELKGRKGKQPDGTAKTREVKLGCVFTQTTLDQDGNPVRDPDSTTYVGRIESSADFGWRLYKEASLRGLYQAKRVVVLTDGARYNKTIVEMRFPHATHIIDLYHALERLHDLAKLLLPQDQRETLENKWRDLLDSGKIKQLTKTIREHLPRNGKRRREGLTAIQYFVENADHMHYAEFRKQGFFVGSGVIEAGCRTVIGQRLKKSGMFWSVQGANAIIASRCCQFSHRFESFWEDIAA